MACLHLSEEDDPGKKYDGKVRKFSRQIFFNMGVEVSLGDVLVKAGNQGWAVDTWRKHNMAEAHVLKYEKEMEKPLKFPFKTKETLNYVGYLLRKGLKGDTILEYLSSIRHTHTHL